MGKQYHYLVAGLPDILLDDSKLAVDLPGFRAVLEEGVHPDDFEIIRLFFYRYDNLAVLQKLQGAEESASDLGNLSEDLLQELIDAAREGTLDHPQLPAYLLRFVQAYKADEPIWEGKSWDLQLAELYYEFICSHPNKYVSRFFTFERDIQNILTALQCRKYDTSVENQVIGKGELSEKLLRSNARDFGIESDFPMLEQLLKAAEEEDLKEFEKKIDLIKWEYLNEAVFFYYFTIETLFTFVIKLSIIERWIGLDKETGQQMFNELLADMEASYSFPDEFKLKK